MNKFTFSLVLLAVLGLGLMPSAANAGKIGAYFDALGTQRSADVGVGLVTLYIYGDGYPGFISGAQYKIDYGPNLNFIADAGTPPVTVGSSNAGISVGFGFSPRAGSQFLIQLALCQWVGDCSVQNVDGPSVVAHPGFPDPTPIVARFPDQAVFPADPTRSVTCQMVELDIRPLYCPNPLSAKVWDFIAAGKPHKGGLTAVAVLGSATVDVNDLDASSILLEGVAPLAWPQTTWFDVGLADGDNDCVCDFQPPPSDDDDDSDGESYLNLISLNRDGYKDLLLFFHTSDLASAIGPNAPMTGTEVVLEMTGLYNDGLPFTASDCMTIIEGRRPHRPGDGHDEDSDSGSDHVAAGLGYPSPNPFNPVTRISYTVPSSQHVHIAIYDVAGRLVENLVNEVKGSGEYVVEWDAGRLPSGVYFYRMQTEGKTIVRRATLLK